jgi:hypothetical protein
VAYGHRLHACSEGDFRLLLFRVWCDGDVAWTDIGVKKGVKIYCTDGVVHMCIGF